MGLIIDIANKKACSGLVGINTGKLGCLSLFGTPLHLIALRKGFVIPKATEFNKAYLLGLVQAGDAIPLIDAAAFEDTSSEDAYSTNAAGQKRLNLKGLPEYKLMFEEGHEFYRQAAKFTSYKSYDFMIGDEGGNWMLATKSDGDFKGFTAGQVVAEMRKTKQQGGDAESKSILVQFLDRLQWDENYAIIHADTIDFTAQEVPLVNGGNVSFIQVPTDLDVILKVKVVLSSDNDTPVTGLIAADFAVSKNGVNEVITGVADGAANGEYDITIAAIATGEVIGVDLFDSGNNFHVIDSNGVLYRADEAFETTIV